MRRVRVQGLWVLPLMWSLSMVGVSAADDPVPTPSDDKPIVSTPLVDAADNFQKSSAVEGPVVGAWRAVTGTEPAAPDKPVPAAVAKKAKAKPLTLREYLNQQMETPDTNEKVSTTDDTTPQAATEDKAQPGGTLLQLGF